MAETLAETLAGIMDSVATVLEAVDGYRAQCLESGYGPGAAEAMALVLHEQLIRKLLA
jgi:hypothetical protein